VSEQILKFKVGQISVRVGPQALATFDAHRQRRFYQREAGFARVREGDWEIVTVTGPRSRDRRGRFSFWPHRASEQEEIFEHHALGLDYVGDWHTHPENEPAPSPDDLTSIGEVVRRSTHHLPGFLLMIVGRDPYPKGLWASFHSVDGTRLTAEDMRILFGPDEPPAKPASSDRSAQDDRA
jgi:integrative and conjugative element protein (TIGR02256 family)